MEEKETAKQTLERMSAARVIAAWITAVTAIIAAVIAIFTIIATFISRNSPAH
jgi:hypothetical protein